MFWSEYDPRIDHMVNDLSLAIVEFVCDLIPDLPAILAISSSYVTTIEDLKLHMRRLITLHLLSGCIEILDPTNSTGTTQSTTPKDADFSLQKIAFDFDRAMTKNCSVRHHGSSSRPASDSTTSQKENSLEPGIDSTGLSSASGNGETITGFSHSSQEIGPACSFAGRNRCGTTLDSLFGGDVFGGSIIDDEVQPLISEPILSDTLISSNPAGLTDASASLESPNSKSGGSESLQNDRTMARPNFGFCQPRRSSDDEPEDQYSSESFAPLDRSENGHRTISATLDRIFQRPRIIDILTGMGDEDDDTVLGSPKCSSLFTGKASEDEHFIARVINSAKTISASAMNSSSDQEKELAYRETRSAANNDYFSHRILAGSYLGVQPTGDRNNQVITQTAPLDLKDGNKGKYGLKLFNDIESIETPAKSRWIHSALSGPYREDLESADFNCGVYLEGEQAADQSDCFNDRGDVLRSSVFLDDNSSRNKLVDSHSDSVHFYKAPNASNCRSSFKMPDHLGMPVDSRLSSKLMSEPPSEFGLGSRSLDAGRPLFCGLPLPKTYSNVQRSSHRYVVRNSTRTEISNDKICIPDPQINDTQRAAFWSPCRSENAAQMRLGADQLANRWRTSHGSFHDGSLCQTGSESPSRLRAASSTIRVGFGPVKEQENSLTDSLRDSLRDLKDSLRDLTDYLRDSSREEVGSHMDDETAGRMVFVSWIPKQTRAYNSMEKPRIEMELISRLRESLQIPGLNRIILFPPKGAHCKLVFNTRDEALGFMNRYGGENNSRTTEQWKMDICRIFHIAITEKLNRTVVKIEWSQK